MSSVDQAVQTQLNNIQKKTGRTLSQLAALARKSGLTRHGELRDFFKQELGLGHGDANTLVHIILKSDGTSAAQGKDLEQVLGEIYTGAKAGMRPIHDRLMAAARKFGDFEIAPKKGYVSLRRSRQFAMFGPKTHTRFELGLNVKDLKRNARLLLQPKGSMCNYIVNLAEARDVDAEVVAWLKAAYESAG
jgi:hypothetical protein